MGLVADEGRRLLGIVTDGDIRRAILRDCGLDTAIRDVMNPRPRSLRAGAARADVLELMRRHKFHHVPLVDGDGTLVGLEIFDRLIGAIELPNVVVLMAGGRGTRLRPLTEECPKPLLSVGDKPILEHILAGFIEEGFRHFYLSVNYKAEMIAEHFGNGDRWGVRIEYLRESSPLGTAGALSLLPARPRHPIVVMNGDLLTKVSFASMLEFHARHGGLATMAVREYDLQIPYGVVTIDNGEVVGIEEASAGRIVRIDEKPVQRFFVNAGIYVLSPESFRPPAAYSIRHAYALRRVAQRGVHDGLPVARVLGGYRASRRARPRSQRVAGIDTPIYRNRHMEPTPAILGVACARGGSKGVPRKNIRPIRGKPLIVYTLEAALKTRRLSRLVVSTDDEEIASVSARNGVEVVARPAALASDKTPAIEPVLHAMDVFPEFEYVVLLQPTSPLRTAADIDGAIETCLRLGSPSCVSVSRSGSASVLDVLD